MCVVFSVENTADRTYYNLEGASYFVQICTSEQCLDFVNLNNVWIFGRRVCFKQTAAVGISYTLKFQKFFNSA